MAVAVQPKGLAEVVALINSALQRARQLKQKPAVEPPLNTADFRDDVSQIASTSAKHGAELSTQHMLVETATRSILYNRLSVSAIRDADFVEVWNLLDIVQICADNGCCEAGLTLWLIEELLDSQTIDGARGVFDYLESRCERLIGADLTQNKRNTILRTCNELLHRLSRAEDAVFCGRVFIFLFKIFPLGDKSAVNLRGEFHAENTTNYDTSTVAVSEDVVETDDAHTTGEEPPAVTKEEEAQDEPSRGKPSDASKAGAKSEEAESKVPAKAIEAKEIDFDALYPEFWALQQPFSNPPLLFQSDVFSRFKSGLALTLAKFKAVPKVPTAPTATKRKREDNDNDEADFASSFNPKYLTSKDLFRLELSDVTFQRHILVQALILIDFLLSMTTQAKKRNEHLKAQKAMVYSYTLGEDDAKWASSMRTQISQYLRRDSEGQLYQRMVDTVLSRDKNWVRWKIESCPPIAQAPVTGDRWASSMAEGERTYKSRRIKAHPMGAIEFGFLSESKNASNLDAFRDPAGWQTPSLRSVVDEARGTQLDLEMCDKERDAEEWAAAKNKASCVTWKALRVGGRSNFAALSLVEPNGNVEALGSSQAALKNAEESGAMTQDDSGPAQGVEANEAEPIEDAAEATTAPAGDGNGEAPPTDGGDDDGGGDDGGEASTTVEDAMPGQEVKAE